ncbi:MAG TPA: dipeptide epimerase [Steroidobacter sp.]|nr:dipeptide epimerase [Steroidobacter sp.]
MSHHRTGARQLRVEIETWPFKTPIRITGYTMPGANVVVVTIEQDGESGRGEAAGVYYLGEDVDDMLQRIEAVRPLIEAGIDRETLQRWLPPCGARNALDCALWDLEAKLSGQHVWQLAGLEEPGPLLTTFTCGAAAPEQMAAAAREYPDARAIKLKLTGEPTDADRVRAVREALPDVWLGIDANQGFTQSSLERLMPVLVQAHVALIEQPFPTGLDALLENFESPIPIAADESLQCLADLPAMVGRFDVVNIKLDKCGGLSEGLAIARLARELQLGVMVGNMSGTSLAMAPAMLLGQLCSVVDLDGPVFLKADRPNSVRYAGGRVIGSADLWGKGGA